MPFWQFFRNRLIGWIGHALQNPPQDLFFLFYILILIYFLKYQTIVRNSAWSFGHSDPHPSSVQNEWPNLICWYKCYFKNYITPLWITWHVLHFPTGLIQTIFKKSFNHQSLRKHFAAMQRAAGRVWNFVNFF